MARYHLGTRTSSGTSATAAWELRSAATDRLEIREIGWFLVAATATTIGLGRPAAIGVTPTTPVTVLAGDSAAPAGTGTVAVAWGTGPTVPTNFLRRAALPAAIGNGMIWTFGPGELVVPVSSSLILWNLGTNSVLDVYVSIDE